MGVSLWRSREDWVSWIEDMCLAGVCSVLDSLAIGFARFSWGKIAAILATTLAYGIKIYIENSF